MAKKKNNEKEEKVGYEIERTRPFQGRLVEGNF